MLTRRPQREPWPFARRPPETVISRLGIAVRPTDSSLRFRSLFGHSGRGPAVSTPRQSSFSLPADKERIVSRGSGSPRKPHSVTSATSGPHAGWSVGRMLCTGGGCRPSRVTGSPCQASGRTTNCRPKRARTRPPSSESSRTSSADSAGVHAVRVVGDRSGRPVEVHVLADPSKPAKQTVRDVRAVAQTMFGIELDHRIVSVAQLDTNDQNAPVGIELPRGESRARIGSINVEAVGLRAQVRVVLADERPRAHRLRRRFGRERRPDRNSSPRPRSTPSARWSPRRKRSTSPAPRSAASARTASRWSPSSTSTRRPSWSCPDRRSCAATATTPWRARCSTPRTAGSPARNADARRTDPSSRARSARVSSPCPRSPSSSRTGSAVPTASPSRHASGNGRCTSSASTFAASPASSTTGCVPTTRGCRSSPSTPSRERARSGRAGGLDRRRRPRRRREPVLAPDQPRRVGDDRRRSRRAPRSRVVFHHHDLPWQRAGLADAAGIPPHRDELAARHHQRAFARRSSRTAASRR